MGKKMLAISLKEQMDGYCWKKKKKKGKVGFLENMVECTIIVD